MAAYKAYLEGDLKTAQQYQKTCVKLVDALRGGSNMSYFKEALKMRGVQAGFMRAPQLDLPQEEIDALRTQLEDICSEAGLQMAL